MVPHARSRHPREAIVRGETGFSSEQEPVQARYPHATAGLLRQFPIRDSEAGEVAFAGGVDRYGF